MRSGYVLVRIRDTHVGWDQDVGQRVSDYFQPGTPPIPLAAIGLGTARFAQPPPGPFPAYSGSLGTEGSFVLSLAPRVDTFPWISFLWSHASMIVSVCVEVLTSVGIHMPELCELSLFWKHLRLVVFTKDTCENFS